MFRSFYSDRDCQFFITIYHFQKKKLLYYIHFEIIIDPCNLISSPHYDVFSNHTIFCSVRLFSSFVHLTKYEMDSSKKSIQLWFIGTFDPWTLFHVPSPMGCDFHRKYDQSEKSKICPKDHLWLSLSWNKKMFAVTVRWKTSKVTYRFHNHCHDNPGSKCIYGFCLWMKSVNISHGWNKFVRYKDS